MNATLELTRSVDVDGVLDLEARYRFSRFAYIHAVAGRFVIESPFTPAVIELTDKAVFEVLAVLAEGVWLKELLEPLSEEVRTLVIQILEKCQACRLLTPLDENGRALEDQNELQTWEFHDLLFHARSRAGRHDHPFGGTYRFSETTEPLPAFKNRAFRRVFPLHVPDMEQLKAQDPPFSQVLEGRTSLREYSSIPLDIEQLGEFLYRSCRHIRLYDGGAGGQVCHRVAPSGGGMHPLEVYLLIKACRGIAPGTYHYHPRDHQLGLVTEWNGDMEAVLADAGRASGLGAQHPPVLICLAARFQRTAWKYAGIAYATILKDVGSLYQTFYLVATAMGLAPCGLGSGNSDTFARLIGSRYYDETTVGEFMLGPCVSGSV